MNLQSEIFIYQLTSNQEDLRIIECRIVDLWAWGVEFGARSQGQGVERLVMGALLNLFRTFRSFGSDESHRRIQMGFVELCASLRALCNSLSWISKQLTSNQKI